MSIQLRGHQHGKNRVRVGRVWRNGGKHSFVEWSVDTMLESQMEPAYVHGNNTDMTATDTQKNTVYYIAKQCSAECCIEEFAIKLAKHFVSTYPKVTVAKISVKQIPWRRLQTSAGEHSHGFTHEGSNVRTAFATVSKLGQLQVISGVTGWRLLKTTQSGYEGYCQDKFTLLPETRERIVATELTASWRYNIKGGMINYDQLHKLAIGALTDKFFGPIQEGVYSPSVQYTLYQMGTEVLKRVSNIDSIYLNMPNIHFLPCKPVNSKFENDVYIATSEPHGNIEACLTRQQVVPHAKL
eukprot:TRINITY_DN13906_c0_g1_i1.p1 TRINITY_DN13906_c0_g1~~TRINITY_DN13906_c0_g1_i1.p1  ORF type:complete len:297 (+),score=8.63 TRINITY_DN13906_c0_g1_i1:137-1027(+)